MAESVLTNEQQEAIIGRVILAKRAAEKRLALLLEESKRLGDAIGTVAGYLRGNAHYVWFDGLSTNENYLHPRGETFFSKDFDPVRIAKLTSEIRDTKDEIKQLSQQERELGL
jgi:hypothetical protein